ncbi:MAG: glycosyltransferase family 2 protein [Planctomycetota bacterium]|jgi:dolichol-phosphate mannosyltransferase
MQLTVVLPFFNEEELLPELPGVCARVREALAGHEMRLLAVDDGSTDRTAEGLRRIEGLEVARHERNRGVGAAMSTGLSHATGEVALVYDPDEAYAADRLPALVEAVQEADVATLSPYHPDGGVEGVGWGRLLLSRTASRLYRWRLGERGRLFTFTCAVRAYRLATVRDLLPTPDDFTAATWLLAAALARGLRVVEVPAVLRARRRGSSKMRLGRAIRAHLRLLHDLPVTAPGSKSGT